MKIVDVNDELVEKLRESGLSVAGFRSLEKCKFWAIEEKDDKIIGVGGMGGIFNVPALLINEKFQGQGLGKKLLELTINEAKKRGFSYISGSRNPENVRAIKLHDYFGFKKVFRVHYHPKFTRDIIILELRFRGKVVGKILGFFNTRVGNLLLSISLRVGKSLFPLFLTYVPDEYPDVDILHMIRTFEKINN